MNEQLARIALGCLVEPGHRELGLLVRQRGAAQALQLVLTGVAAPGLVEAVRARLDAAGMESTVQAAAYLAHAALARAERLGARIVTPADDEWPPQVEHLALIDRDYGERVYRDTFPPMCLWVRGEPSVAETLDRSVAVVGARAATNYGQHVTTELAYGLAERDWTIVSGGAFGIDAAAHRAAMAAGGLTVAILACGIDRPYPSSHAGLFEQIADEGLLMTEWPPGASAHRMRFLTRNRVIAAATRGTVMVEAGARSGARNTLGHARVLNRPVMVVPGSVTSAMSVGCHAELRKPGTVLVTKLDEIIEEVGQVGQLSEPPRGPARAEDALDSIGRRLLDAVLPRKALTAEEIAAVAGLSGREARRRMPELEANGFVVVTESGGYRLPARRRSAELPPATLVEPLSAAPAGPPPAAPAGPPSAALVESPPSIPAESPPAKAAESP